MTAWAYGAWVEGAWVPGAWSEVEASSTSRTAYQERYGESVYAVISANYRVRLPYGKNGARLYVFEATTAGLRVTLQDARLLRTGALPNYTIVNRSGAETFTIRDATDGLLATLGPGDGIELMLADNTTEAGYWLGHEFGTAANTAQLMDRQVVNLVYGNEGRTNVDLVRDAQAAGYDTRLPSSIQVYVVDECVIGSQDTSVPAFSSNLWPAGSTLRLYIGAGARICGLGGAGGRGGDVSGLLAQNGAAGGTAVAVSVDTVLINYGKIQGGGGGGGGGVSTLAGGGFPGGGGGGGAGHKPSQGGPSGRFANGQPYAGGDGLPGSIGIGGAGGGTPAQNGASGGGPGAVGTAAGGLGGDAGNAIEKLTGIDFDVLQTGTIDGAEVFV